MNQTPQVLDFTVYRDTWQGVTIDPYEVLTGGRIGRPAALAFVACNTTRKGWAHIDFTLCEVAQIVLHLKALNPSRKPARVSARLSLHPPLKSLLGPGWELVDGTGASATLATLERETKGLLGFVQRGRDEHALENHPHASFDDGVFTWKSQFTFRTWNEVLASNAEFLFPGRDELRKKAAFEKLYGVQCALIEQNGSAEVPQAWAAVAEGVPQAG